MPDNFDDILDQAENLTNKELDSKISSLIRLTDAEIAKLFPTKPDKENLLQLMQIVRASASDNIKRKQLIDNISAIADAVLKIVGKMV